MVKIQSIHNSNKKEIEKANSGSLTSPDQAREVKKKLKSIASLTDQEIIA